MILKIKFNKTIIKVIVWENKAHNYDIKNNVEESKIIFHSK